MIYTTRMKGTEIHHDTMNAIGIAGSAQAQHLWLILIIWQQQLEEEDEAQ